MKIKMTIKRINSDYTWEEEYNIEAGMEPREFAENLIDNFNNTLRPNETARELIGVMVIDENSEVIRNHKWEKQNLVTIIKGGSSYDIMECSVCGITGKRYGLGGVVKRDSKYNANCYNTCDGAIAQMKKLKR